MNFTVFRFLLSENAYDLIVFTVEGISILVNDGHWVNPSISTSVDGNSISSSKGKSYNEETFFIPSSSIIFVVLLLYESQGYSPSYLKYLFKAS